MKNSVSSFWKQIICCVLCVLAFSYETSGRKLSYPDSVQFLREDNSVQLRCSHGDLARTSWLEYLTCKRSSAGIWHPVSTCTADNKQFRLTVTHDVTHRIVPDFSETFYFISESRCSQKTKTIVHRCDPDAPRCDKCTLPLGVQEGRLPIGKTSISSQNARENKNMKHQLRSSGYGWCGRIEEDDHFVEVDLIELKHITGVATRKTDSVTEFALKYKEQPTGRWHFYKQRGSIELFKVNRKSKGYTSRHWLRKEIRARHVRFQVTKWGVSMCMHVEVYGCDSERSLMEALGMSKRKMAVKKVEAAELRENEESKDNVHSNKGGNTALIACYVAAGLIAIAGLFIVYKWEHHERKIRPEYVK